MTRPKSLARIASQFDNAVSSMVNTTAGRCTRGTSSLIHASTAVVIPGRFGFAVADVGRLDRRRNDRRRRVGGSANAQGANPLNAAATAANGAALRMSKPQYRPGRIA